MADGQPWLELHDYSVDAPRREGDLYHRRQTGRREVTMRRRKRIDGQHLDGIPFAPPAQYLSQQGVPMAASRRRDGTYGEDFHPKASRHSSMASMTPGQV
jgi:hypothetical protein